MPLWGLLVDWTWPVWAIAANGLALTLLAVWVASSASIRPAAVAALCLAAVGLPIVLLITLRAATMPAQYVHDSVVQTEEAMRFIGQGRNPYRESYEGTPLESVPFFGERNPAIEHLVYYPASFLLALPLRSLLLLTTGFYDHRLFLLACFLAALWGAARVADPIWKGHLIAAVGLNPTFNYFLIQGDNDVVLVALILVSLALAHGRRLALAGAVAGLAAATKQSAWFFVALLLADLAARRGFVAARRAAIVGGGVALALVAPFVLWDPAAFFDDTYGYLAGAAEESYPVAGLSLARILVLASLYPEDGHWLFPTLQLGLVAPLLVFCLLRQYRYPGTAGLLRRYGIVLTASFLCARYFSVTHLAYLSVVLVAAVFARSGSGTEGRRTVWTVPA